MLRPQLALPKSGQKAALVLMTGILSTSSLTPWLLASPVLAQSTYDSNSNNYRFVTVIPTGTVIPLTFEQNDKIVVTPEETMPVTLQVAANVRTRSGQIVIPRGTQVEGKIEPAGEGSRFVAQTLVFTDNRRLNIDASSQIVTRTEDVQQGAGTGEILKGAAIGGAAAAVIAAITGDRAIATEEILGGAGLGALGGLLLGKRSAKVVVIRPAEDLDITLNSQLALRNGL